MLYKFIETLDKKLGFENAKAHCDIPCGIYDPILPQIAALTVVRMIDLMAAFDKDHAGERPGILPTPCRVILQ